MIDITELQLIQSSDNMNQGERLSLMFTCFLFFLSSKSTSNRSLLSNGHLVPQGTMGNLGDKMGHF